MRRGRRRQVNVQEEAILGLRQRRGAISLWAGWSRNVGQDGARGWRRRLRWGPTRRTFRCRGVADTKEGIDRSSVARGRYPSYRARVGDDGLGRDGRKGRKKEKHRQSEKCLAARGNIAQHGDTPFWFGKRRATCASPPSGCRRRFRTPD